LVIVLVHDISKKRITIKYNKDKPEGDIGRSADYSLAKSVLNWSPQVSLFDGLSSTYNWILNSLNH
jgi:nucleoside-diphosphate-sugar epimerase